MPGQGHACLDVTSQDVNLVSERLSLFLRNKVIMSLFHRFILRMKGDMWLNRGGGGVLNGTVKQGKDLS